ncbi:hypothetical protein BU23DRAFT_557100 [Bimuria novae-zelandiae CBS 107.79]|uniref:C3H1-type domain-containing protein n=1 Tax=Bimuria novae-zelandiae CBS 107.79 TaxID=1447943 RepID=A0A6A5V008_9PLEO|nr:hypothetical protein BU23DRAFT_557100 [Bimuria novae-zelandiae CBS 107.79]
MSMVVINTSNDFNSTDFVAQMRGFQASDEARQKLFADMLERYTALLEEHETLKHDYSSERDIRRNYQREVDLVQGEVAQIRRELGNSSFVLALIDGDGVIFQDALLNAAANEGGSEAASRLQHAIRNHITSLYDNSGNWPIIVHIYLSLDKLAQKLASVGLIEKPSDLRKFAQYFSLNQSLFTIVDVGHGKERADHKIKEMLRTFNDNPTCRHIVFGGCHDAGYLLNLDQYKHHAAKAAHITLLESTPAWRGFAELPNFRRTRFDNVFRNTELPDYGYRMQSHPSIQPGLPSIPPGFQSSPRGTPTIPSPATTVSSLAAPANPTPDSLDSSWATVGKNGVPPKEKISIAPKSRSNKRWAYYNKDEQRLDEPLAPKDKAAYDAIDQRMKKAGKNLCNHWHLNKGKCVNGAKCHFQHEPKLTSAELNALQYKTRSLACKDRYCQNVHCYLGHQCSFEREQGWCPFPDTCNLRHTHGMDKVKASRWNEDGEMEQL